MRADMFVDKLFKDIVRQHGIREKICKTNYALSSFIKKKVLFYTQISTPKMNTHTSTQSWLCKESDQTINAIF